MEGGPGWPAALPTGILFERAATLPSCSRDFPFILRTQESTALEISASRAQTQMPARMGGGAEGSAQEPVRALSGEAAARVSARYGHWGPLWPELPASQKKLNNCIFL